MMHTDHQGADVQCRNCPLMVSVLPQSTSCNWPSSHSPSPSRPNHWPDLGTPPVHESVHHASSKYIKEMTGPGQVAQLVKATSCTPKGCGVEPWPACMSVNVSLTLIFIILILTRVYVFTDFRNRGRKKHRPVALCTVWFFVGFFFCVLFCYQTMFN
uniref:Uncharacterized protein n=1 Tax=Myotis myotis TaxID=51298 RepID=A0A7J7Y002_MYOMY|nr:hypothetical protein mMyoMyo1_011509 [Myotis myotis]